MMSMRLEDEFRSRAVTRGGVMMLKPADAIALVQRCKERGVTHGSESRGTG